MVEVQKVAFIPAKIEIILLYEFKTIWQWKTLSMFYIAPIGVSSNAFFNNLSKYTNVCQKSVLLVWRSANKKKKV